MTQLYNIGILLYSLLARLSSPFNVKAKQFIAGRKNWKILAAGTGVPNRNIAVVILAGWRPWSDGRSTQPFRLLRERTSSVRQRTLRERVRSTASRHGRALARSGFSGR